MLNSGIDIELSAPILQLRKLKKERYKLQSDYKINLAIVKFYNNHKMDVMGEKQMHREKLDMMMRNHLGEEKFQELQMRPIFRTIRKNWNDCLMHYTNTRDDIHMYSALQLQLAYHNIARKHFGDEHYDAPSNLPEFQCSKKRSDVLRKQYVTIMRIEKKFLHENEEIMKKLKKVQDKILNIEKVL